MANVLTVLEQVLFASTRRVPQELTGFIGASGRDFKDQGVRKGGTVKVPVIAAGTLGTIPAPSMAFAAGHDTTPTEIDFILNQTAQYDWQLSAEDERLLMTSGQAQEMLRQTMAQGWRKMRNSVEAYLGLVAANSASRAVGTAGTTPFGTNTDIIADAAQILDDNGADTIRSLVMSTSAANKIRKLTTQQKVNEAGSSALLRDGVLGRLTGFDLLQSAGIVSHTKGTGTGYTSDTAGYAVGATAITLITGSGIAVAGDCVTFAGDANIYVVAKGVTAPGVITLQEPGLKAALAASAVAMTIGNNYTPNIAMDENFLKLVVRPALQPVGEGIEQSTISDPVSGLSCLVIRKVGDGMSSWYMRQVYDAFSPNPYAGAILLG